jgi:8-oxo-dGTP pyrophosphatase MutT (NUDIX family)
VVRALEGAPHVLLIRDPYHKWGLPKGHLENGERPHEAALREVAEETGLGDLLLGPDLGEIDWTFQVKGRRIHKFCRFFLMASFRGECRPEVEEGISACRWLPGPEALETVTYDNAREVIRRALALLTSGGPPERPPWVRG